MKTSSIADYTVIKRPHLGAVEWQEHQLVELMDCVDDPLYFMRHFMKVQHATMGSLPFVPYPFQIKIIEAFHQNRFCIALTGRQLGKALALDTPLPTPNGWTTMGAVRPGDRLLDEQGRPTTVRFATEVMYGHACYEIRFASGETVIADAGHLWTVAAAMGETITCSTREIAERMTTHGSEPAFIHGLNNAKHVFRTIHKTTSVPVRCIQVDSPSSLFLCTRSLIPTHNTTCAAGFLLWKAMFQPDTTILVVANKFVQAIEVMDRVRYTYENLPDHIRAGVIEYNKSNITFDNGSRIISRATNTDTGRGLAITLLYVDEFAFVPPNKAKSFWTSIQPTLSTGGSCIITSTPKSDEDQFAQIWKGAIDNVDDYGNIRASGLGRNDFFAIKVPWWEHPDRNDGWAETYREQLGEARFRQEMCCEFLTDDETLINPLTLVRLNGVPPVYYTGTVRWFSEPQPNKTYLVGLDPSLGTGSDDAALQVFQLPEMIQVAEWQHNATAPRGQVRVLMQTLIYLDSVLREDPLQQNEPEIYFTVENNSIGEAILLIIEDTGEERFPGTFISEKKRKGQVRRFRKGLNTNAKAKLSACARLKSLIESGRMTIQSGNLIKQMKNFVARELSFAAKPGEQDDLMMALILVVRMLDVAIGWNNALSELREYIDDRELLESEPMPMTV